MRTKNCQYIRQTPAVFGLVLALFVSNGCRQDSPTSGADAIISGTSPIAPVAQLQPSSGPTTQGGWDSGGGELRPQESNAWFIGSVTRVDYCVEIDNENFGTDLENAEEQLTNALAYWRDEFKDVRYDNDLITAPPGGGSPVDDPQLLRPAQQEFRKVSCDQPHSLRFQFGNLHADQIERFRESGRTANEFIAITLRTDYDQVNLSGKGFIYISPGAGGLAPHPSNSLQNPRPDRWSRDDGKILRQVLMHELGHVFGVPHSHRIDGMSDIMDATFPAWAAAVENARPLTHVYGIPDNPIYISESHRGEQRRFYELRVTSENTEIWGSTDFDRAPLAKLADLPFSLRASGGAPLPPFVITDQQRVFQYPDGQFMTGAYAEGYEIRGIFTPSAEFCSSHFLDYTGLECDGQVQRRFQLNLTPRGAIIKIEKHSNEGQCNLGLALPSENCRSHQHNRGSDDYSMFVEAKFDKIKENL